MKVMLDDSEYIEAITPSKNGCTFRLIVKRGGVFLIEPGCYLLVNLMNPVETYLYDRWRTNNKKPFEIKMHENLKLELLKINPCRHCGGVKFEE